MANFITSIRIVCSIAMLFCPIFSVLFYSLYILAGLTDILDGIIARKTKAQSEFGSKFDTFADIIFVTCCLIKVIPFLQVKTYIYFLVGTITIIKIVNIVYGFIKQKKLVAIHSFLNKITGIFLFILPLSLKYINANYSVFIVCILAIFSALQEGFFIKTNRNII